jgi:hypothetical protein
MPIDYQNSGTCPRLNGSLPSASYLRGNLPHVPAHFLHHARVEVPPVPTDDIAVASPEPERGKSDNHDIFLTLGAAKGLVHKSSQSRAPSSGRRCS